jgi:hypothetical protein
VTKRERWLVGSVDWSATDERELGCVASPSSHYAGGVAAAAADVELGRLGGADRGGQLREDAAPAAAEEDPAKSS